jgi:hypothetical protein
MTKYTTLTKKTAFMQKLGADCSQRILAITLPSSLLTKTIKIKMYRTIISPVVMYGCETGSLTLREEHRLRVFKNRVKRKIFGPKRVEVTGEWKILHNKEFHDLYHNQILFG